MARTQRPGRRELPPTTPASGAIERRGRPHKSCFTELLPPVGIAAATDGWDRAMTKEEEYRLLAANCLELRDAMKDESSKASLLAMARVWYSLALQAERNARTDVVYEPPLPKAPTQAVTQQQQQQQQQQIQPDDIKKEE